ncbi:VCBS repeat-containing protein [Maribacter sp. TH_r10]|uniref:FG-GAP repeat domain-containing protein n=1 Tax=Maribacter sp. TH_r10 TaxID=3082086 RepID=UPI0029535FD3|nr:VCBS repeat-containing protein [Maribacter sp. TH_r10]MDV7138835.1 VCBS repeat-containing protein [Maribacter sp. TH_r10]
MINLSKVFEFSNYKGIPSYSGLIIFCALLIQSCGQTKEEKGLALYETRCAVCHIAPSIQSLPKTVWEKSVLPDMGARMGIRNSGYSPYNGRPFKEQEAIMKSGIYTLPPMISNEDWQLLQEYIIRQAPDSLIMPKKGITNQALKGFTPRPITFDTLPGLMFTYLNYRKNIGKIELADMSGRLLNFDYKEGKVSFINHYKRPITSYFTSEDVSYATLVGKLDPSEIPSGSILIEKKGESFKIPKILHRPVHTAISDLNGNGKDELVVSEFGYLTGMLSLLKQNDSLAFEKQVLSRLPGVIRSVVKDMNGDGKKDIVALFSQGDENITIFYQEDDLKFKMDKVIRFSPIYGSSWFELLDYDNDGDDDIITVNGDNADLTYIPKPYHGMRIYINDGNNNFKEQYFYPMNGATRVVSRDFDKDGDIDFALLSTFPNYDNPKESSFVYLENKNSPTFIFEDATLEEANFARWLLIDAGDVDEDGDEDIILSSFSYSFTPVPSEKLKFWEEKGVDVLILENKTNP